MKGYFTVDKLEHLDKIRVARVKEMNGAPIRYVKCCSHRISLGVSNLGAVYLKVQSRLDISSTFNLSRCLK